MGVLSDLWYNFFYKKKNKVVISIFQNYILIHNVLLSSLVESTKEL